MSTSPKRDMYAALAGVAKTLGHEHRLELLELVAQGERTVERLAECAGLSVANASQHLQVMRRAGLISARRQAKFVFYRLVDDEGILGLMTSLRGVAERNASEVQRILGDYFHDRDAMEPVSRAELMRRIKDNSVVVLDVRPQDEFALGHIPGARNVPVTRLKAYLSKLDRNVEVVAYCRGAYCVMSFEAVASLRKRGLKARRLEEGLPEWRAAGLPVERGL